MSETKHKVVFSGHLPTKEDLFWEYLDMWNNLDRKPFTTERLRDAECIAHEAQAILNAYPELFVGKQVTAKEYDLISFRFPTSAIAPATPQNITVNLSFDKP